MWLKQPHKHSSLLQNMGWLCRTWCGWSRNLSLIALPGLMYLSDERVMTVHWYLYNLQPHAAVFLVATATKTLSFAPKHGLPGGNMVSFGNKSGFDCPLSLHVSFWWTNIDFYWYPYNLQPCIAVIWAGFGLAQPHKYSVLLQKWAWGPE